MNKRLQFIFSILFVFLFDSGISQPYPEWEQYIPPNGLIWQTKLVDNILYCGTWGAGLIEYNIETGETFPHTIYNSGLAHNEISAVDVDQNGNIWIGHDGQGISKITANGCELINTENSGLQNDTIYCICVDHNNIIWIGTQNGLDELDGDTWTHYDKSNSGLVNNKICDIEIDDENTKWIGSVNSFAIFDEINWEIHSFDSYLEYCFRDIAISPNGIVYFTVSFMYSKLYKFENDSLINMNWPEVYFESISDLEFDYEGNLWLSLWNGYNRNLVKYDGNYFTDFSFIIYGSEGLRSMQIDGDNNKWIGVGSKGLYKYNDTIPEKINDGIFSFEGGTKLVIVDGNRLWCSSGYDHWQEFGPIDWIDMNGSYGFYIDYIKEFNEYSNFDKVVAGKNELIIFNEDQWFLYNSANSPLGNSDINIQDILVDHDDVLWIAEYGLIKYDGSWTSYNISNSGMPIEKVYSLAMDSSSIIWMGGNEQLVSFDGQIFYMHDTVDIGVYFNEVHSICVDSSNTKWFGTSNGLLYFDDVIWGFFNTENSDLPHNHVTALQIDKTGNLWIGTSEGMIIYNNGTWQKLDYSNSAIPEQPINDIEVADDNTIWISYWEGIARYNQNGFLNVEEFPGQNVSSPQIKCFPNPFTESTTMKLTQSLITAEELMIYNIQGKKVRTLEIKNEIHWDGKDENGIEVNNGIFFCTLKSRSLQMTIKILKGSLYNFV